MWSVSTEGCVKETRNTYVDQEHNKNNGHKVGLPVYRKAVRTVGSRCRTGESVGKSRCIVWVERRGKNRGRGIDGQGDGGGSNNVTDRVCGVGLGSDEEGGEDAVVGGVKEVDEDDDEGSEDVKGVHGGRCGRDVEIEMREYG